MIFEKGERRRTARTTSEHFPKRAKILAFFKGKSTYET